MRGFYATALVSSFLFTACGGSTPPPEEPASQAEPTESKDDVEQPPINDAASEKASSNEGESGGEEASAKPKQDVPEPEFKENSSVADAISAVPTGGPRLNIEQEALSKPLMEPSLYEPCKMGSAHIKFKVAVWNGKAVGIDMATTPKNDKLAECVKGQLRSITWPDKVKSLNTVEYQF